MPINLTITENTVREMSFNSDPVEELYYGGDKVWPNRFAGECIEFDSPEENTITIKKADGFRLYACRNGYTWESAYDGRYTFGGDNGPIRFRGDISFVNTSSYNTYNDGSAIRFYQEETIATGSPIKLSGVLLTLWYSNVTEDDSRLIFSREMFSGLTDLDDASELLMPLGMFYQGSCSWMFANTNITKPPVLRAKRIEIECYYSMFENCKKLKDMPELPGESLGGACYAFMFAGCESLVNVKPLLANYAGGKCYMGMFSGCKSLEYPPEIAATKAGIQCCALMFQGCSNLKEAPEFHFTYLASECFWRTFSACVSLKEAPALPFKQMRDSCYDSMFEYCEALESATIEATSMAKDCMKGMFRGCKSLKRLEVSFAQWDMDEASQRYVTVGWVFGVPASGLFIKPASLSAVYDNDHIPTGWNAVNK